MLLAKVKEHEHGLGDKCRALQYLYKYRSGLWMLLM